MTRLLLLLLAGSFAIPVSAAKASAEPDGRIPTWAQSHLMESDVFTRALYLLGVCIRNRRREAGEAFLRTSPGSPEERAAVPLIPAPMQDPCLLRTTRLQIKNRNVLRGAIAEALYNIERVQPRASAWPDALEQLMPASSDPLSTEAVGRTVAACAARRAPAKTHAVLQFNPGSPGEFRALRALDHTFLACLPQGRNLRVARLSIRAALAEAMYHVWKARPDLFAKGKAA